MMKWILMPFLIALSCFSIAQVPLNTINYSYLYNPETEFSFTWKLVKQPGGTLVLYEFVVNDASKRMAEYSIKFETRKSLGEKEGVPVATQPEYLINTDNTQIGKVKVSGPDAYIIARIENLSKKKAWYVFDRISSVEPFYISNNSKPVIQSFIKTATAIAIQSDTITKPLLISYYKDNFPAAAPVFSTAQAKVSKLMKADSIFASAINNEMRLEHTGLYLIQTDTSSSTGLSLRVENDYPKLATLESLAGPLIYICTRQEFEKIKNANGDKKKFDQVILSITGNTDRARNFMRNYFRRVELANTFFSSYKEGWKTDRGMVYIIFGEPKEVYLLGDREIWEYDNSTVKARFQFVKSPTVFDPDNFVLIREKKFTDTWYQMIDLWRKSRF